MNRRIFDWPLVNESSRNKINRCTDFIFFNARDCGSGFKGYPVSYFATIRLREVRHQYPWLVTVVFFHMLVHQTFEHMFHFESAKFEYQNNRKFYTFGSNMSSTKLTLLKICGYLNIRFKQTSLWRNQILKAIKEFYYYYWH